MPSLSLQDQALRELGRTVYNYQKFEAVLKALIAQTNVYGSGDEFLRNFEKLQSSTSGQTLGALVNRLADTLYGPSKEIPEPDDISKDPYLPSECRIVFTSKLDLEEHIEKLKSVVLARNTLIHHTIGQLKLDSDDACQSFIADLKQQNDNLKPFYEEFQHTLTHSSPINAISIFEQIENHRRTKKQQTSEN
ncbi:hypothetical protein [Rubritalea profundi]|uniref:Uncharacterized protein n=1 Tax=Rubritalea profundi TaxID=1658618 RepID=A0A2S7U4V7_9BACT|nr:hypothetical protein [Rubritalea profundi]PQJ29547.1 hypothetical protein BSZ32_14300 [Rubritalea profundi]